MAIGRASVARHNESYLGLWMFTCCLVLRPGILKIALFSAIFCIGGFRTTLAQSCPPSITAVSQIKQDIPEWGTSSVETTYDLQFVEIIAGPLHSAPGDPNGPEAVLAPQEMNHVQTWPFLKLRESDEIWMRCGYSRTSIKLSTRVHAGVVECFQKPVHSPNEPKRAKIVAACVDESHKNH